MKFIRSIEPPTFFLLITWSILFLVWLIIHPLTPGANIENNPGWWTWWDQGNYLAIATEIFNLKPATNSFWPGYPIIAAPFVALIPSNPFLIINYIFGLFITLNLYKIIVKNISKIEAFLLVILITGLSYKYIYQGIIIPWNTIGIYLFFSFLVRLIEYDDWKLKHLIQLSTSANIAFFLRPQDGIFAILFCSILLVLKSKENLKPILLFSVLLFVFLNSLVFIYYFQVWDGNINLYMTENASHGFSVKGLFERFYGIFFNGNFYFEGEYPSTTFLNTAPSVLFYNPLCAFGLFYLIMKSFADIKYLLITSCNFTLILFYLSFNPSGNFVHFWTYSLFHYIWIYVTIISIYGYLGIRNLITGGLRERIPALSFACFFLVVFISPVKVVEPIEFGQKADQTTVYVKDFFVKKIQIQYQNNGSNKLSKPSNLNVFHLVLNGKPLTIWRDYYLNSSDHWDSVVFTQPLSPSDELSLSFAYEKRRAIKSIKSIEWKFFAKKMVHQ